MEALTTRLSRIIQSVRESTQAKNHSSVISVSTHPINLDVGMSISKNKDEILRINGTMNYQLESKTMSLVCS